MYEIFLWLYIVTVPRLTRYLRHCYPDNCGPTAPCLRCDVDRLGTPRIYNITIEIKHIFITNITHV